MRMRSRLALLAHVVALVAAIALGGAALIDVMAVPAPAGAATATIHLGSGFTFSPSTVTVHVGDTVTWRHDASTTMHTVTADNGSFDSSPGCPATPSSCLGANATFSHTFATAGTFRFYCKIHGAPGGIGMSGVVTVLAATPPPTNAPGTATTNPQSAAGAASSSNPPGATAAPAAASSASLPRTGSNTVPFLLAGAAAILLGGVVLSARRRVRPTR